MAKLTDTQLIVLSKAAQRDDGAAVLPQKMTKAAAAKIAASLVTRKLMLEIRSKPGMPVWRMGDDERQLSLVILKAGREAIRVEDLASEDPSTGEIAIALSEPKGTLPRPDGERQMQLPPPAKKERLKTPGVAPTDRPIAGSPRSGSKQALVIEMLSAPDGATIEVLMEATGWLPHTTRAALTGLRKRRFAINRSRSQDKITRYHLADGPKQSGDRAGSGTHQASASIAAE